MPTAIGCAHCALVVQGPACVVGLEVLHVRCQEERLARDNGKPHRCPECDGKGTLAPVYDPPSGYAIEPTCGFCNGEGWLKVAPKQVTTSTTRWVK
jgi:DnaJ-class molecular chaperone